MKNQRSRARRCLGLVLALVGLLSAASLVLGPARRAFAQAVAPSCSNSGNLKTVRVGHTATLLPNGKVLVAGGADPSRASANLAASIEQASSGVISSASRQENSLSLNKWSSNGPDGGTVLSIAIDRSNPTTIYAGTQTGVFKTTNGGQSWSSSLTNAYVRIVAIAPTTPTTLYAASNSGIYKSTDGGSSWNSVNNGLLNQDGAIDVLALAIDPTNADIIYAAGPDIEVGGTYKAIYKSTNGGGSWSITKHSIRSFAVHHALAIDPTNTNVIHAGGSVGWGTVWKSTDNGTFWTIVDLGPDSGSTVLALAIDPTNTNIIYAGTAAQGVLRSTDGGATWSAFSDGLPYYHPLVSSIVIDPLNPNIVYAGTYGGVFKSSSGGSWSALNVGLTNLVVNALAIDPGSTNILYTGTQGGMFKSASSGASWSASNEGLPGINAWSLALNPGNANVYAGTDLGTFSSNDNGGNWSARDFYPLAFDPRNANIIYARRYEDETERLFKSLNGGASWSSADTGLENHYVSAVTIDPGDSQLIYAASDGLFKSTDGGGSWSLISNLYYPMLAIDPSNSKILYATSYDYDDSLTVFKSADGGVSWNRSDGTTPFYSVSALVLDPVNPATLYVAESGYLSAATIFKSTDSGRTWNPANTGLPSSYVSSLVIDPMHPNNLYAGTYGDGVFKSADGGASWNSLNDGLIDLNINALAIDASGNFLHAGTPAGVFDYQFSVICAYSTSATSESFPAGGAAGSVTVTTAGACNWQASSHVSWVTINSGGSGSGDGTVTFSVAANMAPFPRTATLNIAGKAFTVNQFGAPSINSADDTEFFVRQHYLDFFNRQADSTGLDFWTNNIASCGFDTHCFEVKRTDTSAAFFLSIEFQETGYLVYRIYKSSYGDMPGTPVPVRLSEFLPDTQQIGQGVVVNQPGWETVLENNKQIFAAEYVQRSRFTSAYPTSLTPSQFVDQLFLNTGVTPSATDRTAAVNEFGSATTTADTAARSRVLRRVAEDSTLKQQEFNRAFVLMQYFGYLRRNPTDPPEPTLDFAGYNFWLNKLNQFNGNYIDAEMVKAFINSGEYRQRFGPP